MGDKNKRKWYKAMNIVYVSQMCDKRTFDTVFCKEIVAPQSDQKYHRLLSGGIALQPDTKVVAISALPVSRSNCSALFLKPKSCWENGIFIQYIPIINFPVVKRLMVFLFTFLKCIKQKDANNSCVICDGLTVAATLGALVACKLRSMKILCIVTDLPKFQNKKQKGLYVKITDSIIEACDGYIFLTEEMNRLINKRQKPHVVMEGHVDITMQDFNYDSDKDGDKRMCLYAGGILKKYGIKTLVEAFLLIAQENEQLHIYGSGDYMEELKEVCTLHDCVKYFGVVGNETVMEAELKAVLLINPRPSNEEYTKYSFPSKNMEYMVSGTPVLTTKLPGMPAAYYDYVYLIEDESIECIAATLRNLLDKPEEELHEMGRKAKEFVLKEKNNIVQAEKIVKMIKNQVIGKG